MSGYINEFTGVLNEDDAETNDGGLKNHNVELKHAKDWNMKLIWGRIIGVICFHLGAVYGIYLAITSAKIHTLIFVLILTNIGGLGITAGAHRLWSHRAYKAKLPLRILLMVFNTIAFQYSIIHWSRDHRVHHKFTETDADPYNASRGFFFCHVGWLLCIKHPEVKSKGKHVDVSDLENDPVLRFQNDYYNILVWTFCFILPTLMPVFLWDETIENAWFIAVMLRWTYSSNVTWSVNSVAHLCGNSPYDRFINPGENKLVSILAFGEGWHNYHHVFPWDYKTGELDNYATNYTSFFIDCMAKIGWAYDLKTVAPEMIKRRVKRTGDGTHKIWRCDEQDGIDMKQNHSSIAHTERTPDYAKRI